MWSYCKPNSKNLKMKLWRSWAKYTKIRGIQVNQQWRLYKKHSSGIARLTRDTTTKTWIIYDNYCQHASKYKVDKIHQGCILKRRGCSQAEHHYIPCISLTLSNTGVQNYDAKQSSKVWLSPFPLWPAHRISSSNTCSIETNQKKKKKKKVFF